MIFSRHLRNKLPTSRNWVPNHGHDSDCGTSAVTKPGMLWCALPPGLITEAAAPCPRPLVLQALGIQDENDRQFSSLSELIFGVEWERSIKSVNQKKYPQRTKSNRRETEQVAALGKVARESLCDQVQMEI